MTNKAELLSPAGDLEAGYAALYYGADAVYLGLQKFSARAGAINFDEPSLNRFSAYAHNLKRKVYVAINTLITEAELQDLLESLDICSHAQVDGIILQDLGVARIVRESYPEMELHASTQMAVHNKEGALYLKGRGFKRVVLARELSLAEIKEIASIPNLETEAFIHGALCYSYSGLCQFSALGYGRSANRGKCAYPCRACFKYKDKEEHSFSMKDLALEEDVLKLPVTSLKIEGRKKSALYVAAVTDFYRRILDGKTADQTRADNIKQIFSRPWCKFHLKGKDKNVIEPKFVGHRGLLVGKIEQVDKGLIRFKPNHRISRHDGLQIAVKGFEKLFGFSAKFLKINGKNVFEAKPGQMLEVALPPACPPLEKGRAIYLSSSGQVKAMYSYQKPKPDTFKNAYALNLEIEVLKNKILCHTEGKVFEQKRFFEPAKDPIKTETAIKDCFQKTGGTPFEATQIEVKNKEGLYVPMSLLNAFRRKVYDQIKPNYKRGALPEIQAPQAVAKTEWIIKTDNLSYLDEIDLSLFSELIFVLEPNTEVSDLKDFPKNKIRLALPTVCRNPAIYEKTINAFLDAGFKKWEVGNFWGLQVLPIKKLDIAFDTPLYMLNTEAMSEAMEMGAKRVSLSVEDTLSNRQTLVQKAPLQTTLVVYQDVPLFTSAVCIRKNSCKDCAKEEKWINLEQNEKHYLARLQNCQTIVFDERPLCLATETLEIKPSYFRLDFVYKDYTALKVRQIVKTVMSATDVFGTFKANAHNQKI